MRHCHRAVHWATGLSILILLAATAAAAGSVPEPLASARTAAEQGRPAEASAIYRRYIEAHPLVQSVFVRKDEYLAPSQIHNFLLAFAELTLLQRLSGDEEARQEVLKKLDWVVRTQAIDAINRYHLARVYLYNGRTREGIEALEKITTDQERYPRTEHNKVYLRACTRLLEVFAGQGSIEAAGGVTNSLRRSLTLFNYDLRDRYKIARLLLENGDMDEAEDILLAIAQESDPAVLKGEEYTIIQAAVKLLALFANRSEHRAGDRLLESLEKRFADRPLTPRSQYLLVKAALDAGQRQKAGQILSRLKDTSPGSEWSAKAAAILDQGGGEGVN